MALKDDPHFWPLFRRVEATVDGTDPVDLGREDNRTEPNQLHRKLATIVDRILGAAEEAGTDHDEVMAKLTDLDARLDQLAAPAPVDPVALAAAIAARPEIAATIAAQVAAQLASIRLEVTLSGTASGGIRPPVE